MTRRHDSAGRPARGRLPASLRRPHPDRCDPARADYAEILRCHDEAIARRDDHYIDPATGATVFTAAALWERGGCCDSGCRHCPYVAGR